MDLEMSACQQAGRTLALGDCFVKGARCKASSPLLDCYCS